jgi:hypothetical protein
VRREVPRQQAGEQASRRTRSQRQPCLRGPARRYALATRGQLCADASHDEWVWVDESIHASASGALRPAPFAPACVRATLTPCTRPRLCPCAHACVHACVCVLRRKLLRTQAGLRLGLGFSCPFAKKHLPRHRTTHKVRCLARRPPHRAAGPSFLPLPLWLVSDQSGCLFLQIRANGQPKPKPEP